MFRAGHPRMTACLHGHPGRRSTETILPMNHVDAGETQGSYWDVLRCRRRHVWLPPLPPGGAASSPCSVAGVKIVLLTTQAKSFRLWSTPEFVAWPGGGPEGAGVTCWPAPQDRDLVGGLRSVCNA